MIEQVIVSPGVYTSEKDLTFVTRSIGVTTLGLVGETVKGPAFEPIFIRNYDEFRQFFGGLNPTKFKATNMPQYELPYIAKSYLSQSNQLFVTRVLGFSGYDAGQAWGIVLDAALDTSTVATIGGNTYSGLPVAINNFIEYQVTTGGTLTFSSNDVVVQELIDQNLLDSQLAFLANFTDPLTDTGSTTTITDAVYFNSGNSFTGATFNVYINLIVTGSTGVTGYTSGTTVYYSGSGYSDVEDKIVALLRSRGQYDANEVLNLEVTGTSSSNATFVEFGSSPSTAETDPLGAFSLSGTALTLGAFNYTCSFDTSSTNYIARVLGRTEKDGNTAIFIEELYQSMFDSLVDADKVRGINIVSLVDYASQRPFRDYKQEYKASLTPYVVSELRGSNLLRLFRFETISDGNSSAKEIKIMISNIRPDDKLFDVEVRNFRDTDNNRVVLERFTNLSMNPAANNYIGRRIGTKNGDFESRSSYITVEMAEDADTSDAFPAGFIGYPIRDYTLNGNTDILAPEMTYKKTYDTFENKRRVSLGLSDISGIDDDFFIYKGVPVGSLTQWTGMTKGFHMDVDVTGATIDGVEVVIDSSGTTYSPVFEFETGCCEFRTEAGVAGTDYEKIFARKFTFVPYGGFDGWDVYRDQRTNTDTYAINGVRGSLGLGGPFSNKALSNGEIGINSDYYAFLEGIWKFSNPEAVNINVFATPGIDTEFNSDLVEAAIEMVEIDRADSWYVVTTPDVDASGDVRGSEDVADMLFGLYDTNYTSTYYPWVQYNDTENNQLIWLPPTYSVVANAALSDKVRGPWFAVAGLDFGNVNARRTRENLTQAHRDILYPARINPIANFTSEGIKIWGNKTMQERETVLSQVSVRRMLLQARKLIANVTKRLVFEQNDDVVRNQFLTLVNPILEGIRSERGMTAFRVVLRDTPESIARKELRAEIQIVPTNALEFIIIGFTVNNQGEVAFDNV